jgi:hypothetical protein
MSTHDCTLRWQGLWLPKRGHTPEEYEDAFAGDAVACRFAIADGASESSFAGEWARLLAEGYVQAHGRPRQWLGLLRQRWHEELSGRELPWYAEVKFEEGAFATALGVAFGAPRLGRSRRWHAWAVGDSCLFQMRQDRLLTSFPLTRADEFGNRPDLLCSRSRPGQRAKEYLARGDWHDDDRLLLMTDALAQWFLEQAEAGHRPWNMIEQRATKETFTAWVEELRDAKALRNDDVTLLMIGS